MSEWMSERMPEGTSGRTRECTETRRRRLARRAAAGAGYGFNRAHRGRRFDVRLGWFAHRGGVCRCGQTYRPARPSAESPATWRQFRND
jgi:hypothetical protein